jgi:hypothetical protein
MIDGIVIGGDVGASIHGSHRRHQRGDAADRQPGYIGELKT